MFNTRGYTQNEAEFVLLDELVSANHLVPAIRQIVDAAPMFCR